MSDPASHHRPAPAPYDDEGAQRRNARLGLVLFAAYLAMYGGFMALAAFSPQTMASTPFGGTNLAILYGMGLIVGAIALALLYMVLCR